MAELAPSDNGTRPSTFRIFCGAALLVLGVAPCAPATARELLRADFSSDHWYTAWQNNENQQALTGEPKNVSWIPVGATTAGFEALDGPALTVMIPKGEREGTGLSFYPRTKLGEDPTELYLRYYLRFGSDWAPAQSGKLPGFGGTYDVAGWGGQPSNGDNGWSARGKISDPCSNGKVSIGSYVYHADMDGQYGDSFSWTDGCANGLDKNKWYAIEYHIKINTPGKNDGILRGWIDGRNVMTKSGLRFDNFGQFKIERVWMNVYHGGKIVAPQDLHIFIDDVVVAQEYIGLRGDIDERYTPEAPSDVTVE